MLKNILFLTIISFALLTFGYSATRIAEYFTRRTLTIDQQEFSDVLGASTDSLDTKDTIPTPSLLFPQQRIATPATPFPTSSHTTSTTNP